MQLFTKILFIFVLFNVQNAIAYKEIIGILEQSKDLTPEEINALHPLFVELQQQYDFIVNAKTTEEFSVNEEETVQAEMRAYFVQFLEQEEPHTSYNTNLPTIEEIIGTPNYDDMSQEQRNEYLDMKSILQETLDEAQQNINDIVKQALSVESNLLKLNKPKIVMYIYAALGRLFDASARLRRAAYCTYSHIPQLNDSMNFILDGVDCYKYTKELILRVEQETVNSVQTIRKNILDLANIYKKIAAKNSIVGKIVTALLQITKISKDIRQTFVVATQGIDKLQNELPNAAQQTVNCGVNFVDTLPFIIETVTNLTACIVFIDDTTTDYEFLKPEDKRDFH